jgi:hypothetical protein
MMRKLMMTAAIGAALAGPAAAQSLNDAGRLLQQVLPGQQQPNPNQSQRDRDIYIYEQGRRDQETARQREGGVDDRRLNDRRLDDRRRADDRRQAEDRQRYDRDQVRRRGDQERAFDDDNRTQRQPQRVQPFDNR